MTLSARPPAREAPAPPPSDVTPEAILAAGHRRLRFPDPWEAAFREEALPQRLRVMAGCGLFACLAVILGSINLEALMPDIAQQTWRLVWLWIALSALGFSSFWLKPAWWRPAWRPEAFNAMQATLMSLLVTGVATQSRMDTAITHSAMAAIPVMYSCIAVRQRFYWALGSALICFVAYAGWVRGFTDTQVLFAQSNLRLMSVSFVFVLLANYFFEHGERRTWLLRKVEARQRQALLSSSMRFQQLCNQDALTGLANRRALDAHMERAWAHAVDQRSELALLVIDVDYFKAFNDSKGHPAGDDCLARLSSVLSAIGARHDALVARMGGEEFGIVLPGCSAATAEALGRDICREVEQAAIPHDGLTDVPWVTVSVGGAQACTDTDTGPAMLLERADGALYRAKEQGRNQACFDARPPSSDAAVIQRRWRDRQERRTQQAGEASDVQLSFPSPDPVKEEALQQTLASRFRRLRFPREQEAAFRDTLSEQRRRELVWLYILGLVIFNVYILVNRPMFPDIGADVLMVQMGVTGGLFALCVLAYVTPLTLGWREGLFGAGTSVIALTCAWVLSQSRLTSTLNFAAALALIPMFVAVGARQSFRATCMPAVMTFVSAAWLLSPQDAVQKLVYIDTLFIIATVTLFSLVLAYTLEYGQRRDWLLSQIDDLQRQALEMAASRLQLLSSVDPLTGICNRRQFEEDLSRIWQDRFHDRTALAMLIIDVDHFKQYNDGYGHPQGDRCLKRIATIIHQAARAERTLAARLGGEEFVILMPKASSVQSGVRLGERVCQAVRDAGIEHVFCDRGHVTVSIGAALIQPDASSSRATLFSSADKALYEAKRLGRDRVAASRPAVTGETPMAWPKVAPAPSGTITPHD